MNQLKVAADLGSAPLVTFAGSLLLACCACVTAQEPAIERSQELEAPTPLRTVDGKIIESDRWSVPTVADIDGDGKQDLIVGQFMNHKMRREGTDQLGFGGTVRWYRNQAKGGVAEYLAGVDIKSDDGLMSAANW